MKNLVALLFFLTPVCLLAQPSNGTCATADSIGVGSTCFNTAGNLYLASAINPTGSCGSRYSVWYKFRVPSYSTTVTISVALTSSPSSLTTANTFIELYNTSNCTLNNNSTGGCQDISSARTYNSLTPGAIYYFRVCTSLNPNANPTRWGFNVCVGTPPSGRMQEIFKSTTLSPSSGPTQLNDPWEIAYGPDNYLWVTESKGYKVYRIDPSTGARTTVLDLNYNSTDLSAWGADSLRADNSGTNLNADSDDADNTPNKFPQGGLAGLALHPKFLNPDSAFVYISYIHKFLGGTAASVSGGSVTPAATAVGNFYRNKLVRFKYNSVSGKLESPVVLCDTLPGSSDHSSQRIIVAPVAIGGPSYVFYASGDMGAGQYENRYRKMNAQNVYSYEGKILRFNTKSDGDAGGNAWIPNDNPYGANSAVYSIGIRNNQGFAYDSIRNILYGSSHGPYSDDEINIIEGHKNYGHPMVIGFAADGNYNGTTAPNLQTSISAGYQYSPTNTATMDYGNSSIPPVGNEQDNADAMTASGTGEYKDPLFSAYPTPKGTLGSGLGIANVWGNKLGNGGTNWGSEAWSGLDIYQHTLIPGWHKSLVASSLKWARLVRLPLGPTGTTTLPSNIGGAVGNVGDTIAYFDAANRLRDIAFSPDGKDIFVVMDKSTSTSGPSANNPSIPSCAGCLIKYTFLGYADNGGRSSIPTSINVTTGNTNQCLTGTTVNINDDNKYLWVPITGPDGKILAEIFPNGQVLGNVTSSFYLNGGAVRSRGSRRYMDRNITITPQFQPTSPVKVRLYITNAEYTALQGAAGSAVTSTTDVKIFKNDDACGATMSAAPNPVTMSFDMEAFGSGYVLQGSISSFSTFYFGSGSLTTLPVNLVEFTGSLQNKKTVLNWKTENEINISHYEVERSIDGATYSSIGTVAPKGTSSATYQFIDAQAANQQSQVLYYRLKMLDMDGKYTYSNIVVINLGTPVAKVTIAPNPVHDRMKVTISSPVVGKASWKITDNTGRVLIQSSSELKVGVNNLDIYTNTLSGGIYYLTVSGTGIEQKQKFQKL